MDRAAGAQYTVNFSRNHLEQTAKKSGESLFKNRSENKRKKHGIDSMHLPWESEMEKDRDGGRSDSNCIEKIVAEATADLRKVYRPKEPRRTPIAKEEWLLLVVRHHGIIVGRVELCCHEGVGHVRGLAIERGHRHQGFATYLMEACALFWGITKNFYAEIPTSIRHEKLWKDRSEACRFSFVHQAATA